MELSLFDNCFPPSAAKPDTGHPVMDHSGISAPFLTFDSTVPSLSDFLTRTWFVMDAPERLQGPHVSGEAPFVSVAAGLRAMEEDLGVSQ